MSLELSHRKIWSVLSYNKSFYNQIKSELSRVEKLELDNEWPNCKNETCASFGRNKITYLTLLVEANLRKNASVN